MYQGKMQEAGSLEEDMSGEQTFFRAGQQEE
jgi:hypothetical protein